MATDQSVPAFGTYALLIALTEIGLIPDTTEEDEQTLADARVVQFPEGEADPTAFDRQ